MNNKQFLIKAIKQVAKHNPHRNITYNDIQGACEHFSGLEPEGDLGVEVGMTCPVCQLGKVEEIGGCNTCTNCNTQLKCGL